MFGQGLAFWCCHERRFNNHIGGLLASIGRLRINYVPFYCIHLAVKYGPIVLNITIRYAGWVHRDSPNMFGLLMGVGVLLTIGLAFGAYYLKRAHIYKCTFADSFRTWCRSYGQRSATQL